MPIDHSQLKRFLADAGLMPGRDFDAASHEANETGRPLDDILTSRYALGEDDLRRAQARILGIPYVSLLNAPLSLDVLSIIPEPIARQESIVAFSRDGNIVEVAMLAGNALEHISHLGAERGLRVLPRLTDSASMTFALRTYQKFLEHTMGKDIRTAVEDLQNAQTALGAVEEREQETDQAVARATARIADTLVRHAAAQNASNIHLEPRDDTLAVRLRIGGRLYDAADLPLSVSEPLLRHFKKISGMHVTSKGAQEGRFVAENAGERLAVRTSSFPSEDSERLALRLMREKRGGFSLESLGLTGDMLEHLHRELRRGGGLFIVAGPSRSGITTTLYTLLDMVSGPHVHTGTVEDTIEYRIPHVHHTEIHPDHGFTHAEGVRAHMRQDADIIMVSNLRDPEAARTAVSAALHGRLVLAGIQAASAPEALDTLAQFGIDRAALAAAVRMVIAQRLVRKLGEARRAGEMDRDVRSQIEPRVNAGALLRALKEERAVPQGTLWRNLPFYTAAHDTAYQGNTGIFEVMPMSTRLKDLFSRGAASKELTEQARAEGMFTLAEHGVMRAAQGHTSLDEIIRALGE